MKENKTTIGILVAIYIGLIIALCMPDHSDFNNQVDSYVKEQNKMDVVDIFKGTKLRGYGWKIDPETYTIVKVIKGNQTYTYNLLYPLWEQEQENHYIPLTRDEIQKIEKLQDAILSKFVR